MDSSHDESSVPARERHRSCGPERSHDLRSAGKRNLIIAFALIAGFMFVEVIGGILSGSLALLADAGHMLTDAASIGLALLAMHFAGRPHSVQLTFGYHRLEILAALVNALALWLIAAWVLYEAYGRFRVAPEVDGGIMLSIGAIGLCVNLGAAWILHRSSGHNVNIEGVFLHVVADLLGSVGVVISGILIWAFGWTLADPIASVVIAVLILAGSLRLMKKVVHVLLEGAPEHVDVHHLCSRLEAVEGVTQVHDIHVWTLSPGNEALTAHVLIDTDYPGNVEALRLRLRNIIYNDFGIGHITLQVEKSLEGCTEDHHFDNLAV